MQLHIHKMMDNIEDSSVKLEETEVVSSEKIKELTKMKINNISSETGNTGSAKRSSKKLVTIGIAAAFVAVIGIGSYAAFQGGLEGVSFGKSTEPEVIPVSTDSSDVSDSSEETYEYQMMTEFEMISLQGYSESPEFKAAKEWSEFEDNYDTDWKILNEVGNNPTEWDDKYGAYNVYSQEMADKVDEITSRYGLTLHSSNIGDADKAFLDNKFGTIVEDANYAGYIFDDGTFSVDGEFGIYDFQLRRTVKGVFDTVYLNVGNSENFDQWTYKTASGVEVSLALSNDDSQAIILADLDDSFVAVNVLLWLSENPEPMTRAELENMADHINFNNL